MTEIRFDSHKRFNDYILIDERCHNNKEQQFHIIFASFPQTPTSCHSLSVSCPLRFISLNTEETVLKNQYNWSWAIEEYDNFTKDILATMQQNHALTSWNRCHRHQHQYCAQTGRFSCWSSSWWDACKFHPERSFLWMKVTYSDPPPPKDGVRVWDLLKHPTYNIHGLVLVGHSGETRQSIVIQHNTEGITRETQRIDPEVKFEVVKQEGLHLWGFTHNI